MKKSNLLILIVLLLFPLGMLVHNLALRAAFHDAREQPVNDYHGDRMFHRTLPSYSHIVVEGGVRLKSARKRRISINNVHTQIWVGPDNKPSLQFRADMKPFIRTEVRNDTLYCWFEADNSRDWMMVARSYRELTIRTGAIKSIRTDSVNLDIVQLAQDAPVALQCTNMTVANIQYVDIPLLDLKGNHTIMYISGGKMDTLKYELGAGMYLTVQAGLVIGKKEMVKTDPHSSFNIAGIPADSTQLKK